MCAISKKKEVIKELRLILSTQAKEIFDKYRQIKPNDVEACGILIGNHSINGKQIKVRLAPMPQAGDIRGKYSFKINTPTHQEILDRQFKLSNKEDVYVGTWDTHPEKNPSPSRIDIQDWEKQYRTNKHLFNKMIFVIIGIDTIKFWVIYENKLHMLEKRSIDYE